MENVISFPGLGRRVKAEAARLGQELVGRTMAGHRLLSAKARQEQQAAVRVIMDAAGDEQREGRDGNAVALQRCAALLVTQLRRSVKDPIEVPTGDRPDGAA